VFGPLGKTVDIDGNNCDGSCSIDITHSAGECKVIQISSFGRVSRGGECSNDA
jgi:hypothetical protein